MKFNIHVTKMRDVDPLLHALGEKRKTSLFPQPPPFERGIAKVSSGGIRFAPFI